MERGRVVMGEDVESEEEESQFDRSESESLKSRSSGQPTGVILLGEAPESDSETEGTAVNFGSTTNVSITPKLLKKSRTGGDENKEKPKPRDMDLEPNMYRKHVERNKSLRKGLAYSFLQPIIIQNAKKLEKLSQNLSNSQMQMQEALLQSRIGTGNFLRLQLEIEQLSKTQHLRSFKKSERLD